MSNPNKNPVTNPLSASDLLRIVQEGYSGDISLTQLATLFGGAGAFGVKSVGLLAQSGVAVNVTNTTALTLAASVAIPPIPINGGVRVSFNCSMNNGANVKNAALVFGGVTLLTESRGNVGGVQISAIIRNRGAQNSQWVAWQSFRDSGAIAGGTLGTTLDTSVSQALGFWVGPTVAGADYITLDGYTVEPLNP